VLNLITDVLLVVAASAGTLCMLLLCFGETHADPVIPGEDQMAFRPLEGEEEFIAMPGHLKTADEMIGWMTRDLPKLTNPADHP
jgi:hypothetical protein